MLRTPVMLVAAWAALAPQEMNPTRPDGPTTGPSSQATSTPTTQPSQHSPTPEQLRIIEDLLREQELPRLITPSDSTPSASRTGSLDGRATKALIPEGRQLVGRSGTLVVGDDRAEFRFTSREEGLPAAIELLPNSLLELMEQEAARGAAEFVISGDITAYRGVNFLIVRSASRRIINDNIQP